MNNKNKTTPAATEVVTKEELKGLSNSQIAIKLYSLLDNEDRYLDAFMEIGDYIKSIAANKKKWKKS